MPTKKEIREARTLIRNSMIMLDECWEHHQDGSAVRVDDSTLFSVVFNEVISGHPPGERTSRFGNKFRSIVDGKTGLRKAFMLLGGKIKADEYLEFI